MLKKFSQVFRITGLTILLCTEKFQFVIDAWFSQVWSQFRVPESLLYKPSS